MFDAEYIMVTIRITLMPLVTSTRVRFKFNQTN